MAILPGVLGCRPLRRTVQVRLGTNPALPRDEWPGTRRKRLRCAWHTHLRGLSTAILEISWLEKSLGHLSQLLVGRKDTKNPFAFPNYEVLSRWIWNYLTPGVGFRWDQVGIGCWTDHSLR